jgi:hypothetical protein
MSITKLLQSSMNAVLPVSIVIDFLLLELRRQQVQESKTGEPED